MSLQVWLPLNGNLNNYGLANITLNFTPTYASNGKIGSQCLNSQVGYFAVPAMNGKKQMSFAYWVKINTGTSTNWLDPFTWLSTDGTNQVTSRQEMYYYNTNGNTEAMTTGVWYASGSGTSTNSISGFANQKIGQWYHYAFTINYTTGIARFYINGELQRETTNVNTSQYIQTGNAFRIRESTLDCSINDFRLYDHCLSAKEVKEIAKGLVLHYKLDNNGLGNPNLLPCGGQYLINSPWSTTLNRTDGYAWVTNSAFEASPSTTYTISVQCDGTLSNAHSAGGLSISDKPWSYWLYISNTGTSKNWQAGQYDRALNLTSANNNYRKIGNTHVWTVTLASTEQYISIRTNSYSDGNTNLTINWWNMKIEKGTEFSGWSPYLTDTNIIYDVSGYNHAATANAITWSSPSPRYSVAAHLGTTSSKIHITGLSTSGFGNSYSFAWWGKRNSNSPMFWGFSDGIRLNGMYIGNLWNTGDGSNNPLYNIGTTTQVTAPSTNVWHHYVMTGNGTKCYVYLDGELWAEAKTYKAISGTSIYINGWDSGTSYCSDNTDMSDFRIYATALSADDVKELYHTSASIDSNGNIHAREVIEI